MFDKDEAKGVFTRYTDQYDPGNIMVFLKIEHTFLVAELAERYAKAQGMCISDVNLAWFLGLLHDVGRFEQVRRFGTYVDSLSVDHAELSGDILFRDGLIEAFPKEGLPEDWRSISETAIRLHNKLNLPDTLDERTLLFSEILRDADKTDIFRVVASIPFVDRLGNSRTNYNETGEASPEVMECVLEHRCVPRNLRRSPFDGLILDCCMAFELVFEISRRTVSEQGYLWALFAETDDQGKQIWTDRETEQLRIVKNEIEKAWGL